MGSSRSESRRNFLKNSSLTLGAGFIGLPVSGVNVAIPGEKKSVPGTVNVASVDLNGLWPETTRERRIERILQRMESVAGSRPDIICLPELFDTSWVEEEKPLGEIAEDETIAGPVTRRIAAFAKKYNCYVACPIFTTKNGKFYNSTLLLDRKGKIAGVYHKMHPTNTEVLPNQAYKGGGIIPGALDQRVLETDFGKVGVQICYDANWADGWENFGKQEADIVLFPSQFPGGRMLNYYALKHGYYIISSTGQDARIIDKSGNDLQTTTEFVRYVWDSLNLDKVNVPVWPTNKHIPDILKKYDDRVGIKSWSTTDVMTIESRDPKLKVRDILKEFDIPINADLLKYQTEVQDKYRSAASKQKKSEL